MKPVSVNVRIWSSKRFKKYLNCRSMRSQLWAKPGNSSQSWIVVGRIVPRRYKARCRSPRLSFQPSNVPQDIMVFMHVYALLKLDMESQKMGLEHQFLLNRHVLKFTTILWSKPTPNIGKHSSYQLKWFHILQKTTTGPMDSCHYEITCSIFQELC